jgi:two-component system chemotaxis sensor kinase CheA
MVVFPPAVPDRATDKTMTSIPAPAHTILIVEDDDDSRMLLSHLLTGEGYEVAMAGNGLEALAAARLHHPALILLDVQMPVMDGIVFRRHQLEDPAIAAIPVVCVSALDSPAQQARDLQAVAFVRKPIDVDRLLRIVRAETSAFVVARVLARVRVPRSTFHPGT